MRRIVCLMAAVFFLVGSAAAWDAESFVGLDDPFYYDLAPVAFSAPAVVSAEGAASSTMITTWDAAWSFRALRPYGYALKFPNISKSDFISIAQMSDFFGSDQWTIYKPEAGANYWYPGGGLSGGQSFSFPALSWDEHAVDRWVGPVSVHDIQLTLSAPIENPGGATAISFSLDFPNMFVTLESDAYSRAFSRLDVFIDGVQVRSYTSLKQTWAYFLRESDIFYSSSKPISKIQLVFSVDDDRSLGHGFVLPVALSLPAPSGTTGPAVTASFAYRFHFLDNVTYSLLDGNDILNEWNDQAQDDLNKHEEYESQWVGSMTENFNNLNLSNFTFPVGLISGFDLLRGIFQDLWNGMGEYRILYVFPLTLAVVLLLIGRLAKDTIKGPQRAPKDKGGGRHA